MSILGWIARIGVSVAIMATMFGLAALIQCIRDQNAPIECEDCGATDWLEADECHTCLMCGELRRR